MVSDSELLINVVKSNKLKTL